MAGVRFALLGPLILADQSGERTLPGARQRMLLATLLFSANVPVSRDALAEAVWDGSPPAGAVPTLRSHVRRLRQAVGPHASARITARAPGYLVCVREAELDVLEFEALCRDAGAARQAARWAEVSAAASAALELWRGPPLLDVPSQVLRDQFVPQLEQLRLQALEDRIEASLQMGQHDRLVPELRALVSQHPLRERFWAQLMQALVRVDRQAEALEAYRQARRALVGELGVEPGPGLQLLHQQILAGDRAYAPQAPASSLTTVALRPAQAVVPGQLPAPVPFFVGRKAELAALGGLLEKAPGTAGTVMISAISGTAGVGKTALALRWAHQVAEAFPGGQLYVNLRGHDPGPPVLAEDALAGFLRALGVPGQDIPAGLDERAARYRSLLAGRRVLVVLDNARDVGQMRPLLPGAPGCLAVVTSRDSLAGLVARDGAERVDLDLLPLADAVSLLRALIGGRVDADPGAAAVLARSCARLPLALRVAAEFAAARPADSLASLAGELADQRRRLDLLDAGRDLQTAVRAVFSWSYRDLDAVSARMFRLLGLALVPDLDRYAAAALAGATPGQAGDVLALLARAHLIQSAGAGRYGLHDLLRAYARELALAHGSRAGRRAALTRLFDYYLYAADAAADTLHPAERHLRLGPAPSGVRVPPMPGPAAARAWLDAHRASLVAVCAHAAAQGWPGHATRLATALNRYLTTGGHYAEAAAIHGCAYRAAGRAGDRLAEATALSSLAVVDWQQGRYQRATRRAQRALALFRDIGHINGQASVLNNLGLVDSRQGHHQQAARRYTQALALFRQDGNQAGEECALANLGYTALQQGRHQQATDRYTQALTLSRQIGHHRGEAVALNGLGEILLATGQPGHAHAQHAAALSLAIQVGDQAQQARALDGLGHACHALGQPGQAHHHWEQALTFYTRLGGPEGDQIRARLTSLDHHGPGS